MPICMECNYKFQFIGGIEVVLTEKGAALEKPVLDTIDTANIDILADISDEEQQILKKNLRLLAGLKED